MRSLLATLVLAAGCGGSGPFALTAAENDPQALKKVFDNMEATPTGPLNESGAPLAAVATKSELALVDLAKASVLWKTTATVESRIAIAGGVIVAAEAGKLVARDLSGGSVKWRHSLGGDLVGLAADRDGVYFTTTTGKRWTITALSANSGSKRWSAGAGGVLGAPTAFRGVVMVPFLNQWLALLDARSGKSLTRVRAVDEEIEFVTRRDGAVFFGSKKGVFLLDVRAAGGSRAQSTYGTAAMPKVFENLLFARDAYDAKQSAYTALDQRQLLWTAAADGDALAFSGGVVTAHYYRYLIGIAATDGSLRWAYSHPKLDLIAAGDVGGVIVAIAKDGGLISVDASSGAILERRRLEGLSQVRGATFDAQGYRPTGAGEAADTVGALVGIVADRDSRFARVKKLAISSLAAQSSPVATSALIEITRSGRGELAETAAKALVSRADPSGASALIAELEKKSDCVALCATALAAIEKASIEPGLTARAEAALLRRFESPATSDVDFAAISAALGRHAGAKGIAAMRRFFLLHRADPQVAENREAVGAIASALAAAGGSARAAVVFAANDPVTEANIVLEAKRALAR